MKGRIAIGAVIVVLAGAAAVFAFCSTMVEPGFIGIRVNKLGSQRDISNVKTVVGRVFFNPLTTEIVTYPTKVQRIIWTRSRTEGSLNDDAFDFNSSGGVSLNADVSIAVSIKPKDAARIYTKYRASLPTLVDGIIRDIVRDGIARAASENTADKIVGAGREKFRANAYKYIKDRLAAEGFTLDNFSLIGSVRVPPAIQKTIDEKIAASQKALTAQVRLQEVKAEADQKVEAAQGDAQATLIRAKAQAQANDTLAKSLTPAVIQYQTLQLMQNKWDGRLPQVSGGGSQGLGMLLQVPSPHRGAH